MKVETQSRKRRNCNKEKHQALLSSKQTKIAQETESGDYSPMRIGPEMNDLSVDVRMNLEM